MRNMNKEGMEEDAEPNVHLAKLVDPDQFVHSVIDILFVKHRWSEGRKNIKNTGYATNRSSSQ